MWDQAIDAGDGHVSSHGWASYSQDWVLCGVSEASPGGSRLSSARFTNNSPTTASCWIDSARLRCEPSSLQARSVVRTLREARVSQAWLSRVSVSMLGRMVKTWLMMERGRIYFLSLKINPSPLWSPLCLCVENVFDVATI